MQHRAASQDLTAIAMGLAFAVIWSSAFSAAKFALGYAPPFLLLAARFLFAGVVATLAATAIGARLPRDPKTLILLAAFGLCQNALYLGLNFLAMTQVPASLAAIIASALPLSVAAMSFVLFRERLGALGVVGLVTGFAGVVLIMGGRIAGGVAPEGVALCLGGLAALTLATLSVRGLSGVDPLLGVGVQMLVGGAALLPVGLALESLAQFHLTPQLGLAFLYIAFIPGLLATFIWFRLVARIGATAASAFHFLNPPLGVGIAALTLGETLGPTDLAGAVIVAAAIAAVQIARARVRSTSAPPPSSPPRPTR